MITLLFVFVCAGLVFSSHGLRRRAGYQFSFGMACSILLMALSVITTMTSFIPWLELPMRFCSTLVAYSFALTSIAIDRVLYGEIVFFLANRVVGDRVLDVASCVNSKAVGPKWAEFVLLFIRGSFMVVAALYAFGAYLVWDLGAAR